MTDFLERGTGSQPRTADVDPTTISDKVAVITDRLRPLGYRLENVLSRVRGGREEKDPEVATVTTQEECLAASDRYLTDIDRKIDELESII